MALNEAQEKLAQTLGELRSAQASSQEGLQNNAAAIAALTTAQEDLRKAHEDLARERSISAADGPDSGLRQYKLGDDETIKRNRHAYVANELGKVRMIGHEVHGGNGWRYGLLDDPNPRTAWQREFQGVVTLRNLVRVHQEPSRRSTPFLDEMVASVAQDGPNDIARIFANNTAKGAEWIPDNTFPGLEEEVQHMQGVHKLFAQNSLPPGGTMKLPYREGNLRPYLGVVPTTNNPPDATLSDLATRENSITAVEMVIATQVHRNASEDSIVAVAPQISADIARAMAFGFDNICINGDTAAAHQDTIASWDTRGVLGASGLGNADDHRRAGIGLRARAFDVATTSDLNATQTTAGLRTLLKLMGPEYFARLTTTGTVKLLVSPEWFLGTMLGFTDMITWDKAGAAASILTGLIGGRTGPSPGSVGFVHNVEVVMTPMLTPDLATSGLYTGSGSTTACLAVETSDFEWRIRKGMMVETAANIMNNTVTTVSRDRRVFRTKANDTTSSKKNVSYGFNLTS